MPLVKDLADREKVPQRLGHLLLVDLHESVVDPVPGKLLARRRAGLGNLVLVVREDEVLAAPVDVERVAQVLDRHGGTFDVPARASWPPRTRPGRITRLGGLPQRKVHRVALTLIHFDAATGLQLVELAPAYPPVGVILLHVAVDIAVDPVR